jgi:hypothetical protein
MDTIVLTTANSKTTESHKYSYKLTNAMKLDDQYICLSNLSMYYTWKNIKKEYHNDILSYTIGNDISITTALPDGSYSVKDINNYLHMTMLANGGTKDYPISIYANPTINRVSVICKEGCTLTFKRGLAKLLGFSNPVITESTHGDLVPQIERVEAVMVHCSLAQNNFTQDSSLIFSFVPDSPFGTQLYQKPNFPLWRQTRKNSDIREINIWFTDQVYRPLEIEDNILVEIQLASRNLIKT